MDIFTLIIGFIIFITVWSGVKIVPQQNAWVVERMGKYNSTLVPGLNFLIPFIDKVAYRHSLKENAIDIPSQSAITKDNVTLSIDGVLYLKNYRSQTSILRCRGCPLRNFAVGPDYDAI